MPSHSRFTLSESVCVCMCVSCRFKRSAHAEGRDLEHCAHDQEQQDHRPHQDPKDLQGEAVLLGLPPSCVNAVGSAPCFGSAERLCSVFLLFSQLKVSAHSRLVFTHHPGRNPVVHHAHTCLVPTLIVVVGVSGGARSPCWAHEALLRIFCRAALAGGIRPSVGIC